MSAVVVALLATAGYMVNTRSPRSVDTPQFGRVRLYPPWLDSKGFIYLFSDARGWRESEEEAARDFARAGQLVIGIDTPQFLAWAAKRPPTECVYMPGLLEDYSRVLQRSSDNRQYLAPALLGDELGATLVYMAQLQAPPTAFNAAVMIDPQDQIALQRPFCDHPPAAVAANGVVQTIRPEPPGANVAERVLLDAPGPGTRALVAAIPGVLPGAVRAGATLHDTYKAALASIDAERASSGVGDLPLAEVPAVPALPSVASQAPTAHADTFAILYSGDGGWRDLDRSLATILAAKGLSVVGVDVLRYYWTQKKPAVAAADLARIARYYQQRWHKQKLVLIGFSFGADVLPFLVSRLPADLKSDVSLLSLLAPERRTAFEVETTGWLGVHNSAGMPIAPELKKLAGLRVQCIYGRDEGDDSLCTTDAAPAVDATVLVKDGGHHFDKDYAELADQILAAVP
jgi:type IV secretory pathway VirJ component